MEMTGAQAVCHILKEEGVKYIFGVPGNSEVPLLDALGQTPEIKYISAVHESVSIGMADGYARASGNVGVVLVHTTPGTANIIGNLTNAYDAGTPIVVIAGQQDSRLQWSDPLLDSDLLPMVSQHTKDRWWVGHSQDIGKALYRAFKEATTPPTGPVFVVIPRDLQAQTFDFNPLSSQRSRVSTQIRPDRECLERTAQLLVDARQPAIMAGYQVPDSDGITELVTLAELLGAPVFTTGLVPKFIFPTDHPLYYGRVPPIGFALPGLETPADVLLAVGSRLFKQLFYLESPLIPESTKLIHLDTDPRGLARDCPAEIALVADPKVGLAELTAEIERIMSPAQREKSRQRFERLAEARERTRAVSAADFKKEWDSVPLKPSRVVKEIAEALPPGTPVIDEAVMLTSYVASIMDFSRPGSYFCSISCLGWGMPASLGVALANPGKPVVALVGDGCALFGIQSLWTAAKYRIPVVTVVLNNRCYNAIKWGFAMYPERGSPEGADLGYELGNVDFPELAGAFGIGGQRIEDATQIGPAIRSAIDSMKPALLDIIVDPRDVGYGLPGLS